MPFIRGISRFIFLIRKLERREFLSGIITTCRFSVIALNIQAFLGKVIDLTCRSCLGHPPFRIVCTNSRTVFRTCKIRACLEYRRCIIFLLRCCPRYLHDCLDQISFVVVIRIVIRLDIYGKSEYITAFICVIFRYH